MSSILLCPQTSTLVTLQPGISSIENFAGLLLSLFRRSIPPQENDVMGTAERLLNHGLAVDAKVCPNWNDACAKSCDPPMTVGGWTRPTSELRASRSTYIGQRIRAARRLTSSS